MIADDRDDNLGWRFLHTHSTGTLKQSEESPFSPVTLSSRAPPKDRHKNGTVRGRSCVCRLIPASRRARRLVDQGLASCTAEIPSVVLRLSLCRF